VGIGFFLLFVFLLVMVGGGILRSLVAGGHGAWAGLRVGPPPAHGSTALHAPCPPPPPHTHTHHHHTHTPHTRGVRRACWSCSTSCPSGSVCALRTESTPATPGSNGLVTWRRRTSDSTFRPSWPRRDPGGGGRTGRRGRRGGEGVAAGCVSGHPSAWVGQVGRILRRSGHWPASISALHRGLPRPRGRPLAADATSRVRPAAWSSHVRPAAPPAGPAATPTIGRHRLRAVDRPGRPLPVAGRRL
jgi:hypothetical protein